MKYERTKSPLYGLSSKRKLYDLLVVNNKLLSIPHHKKSWEIYYQK